MPKTGKTTLAAQMPNALLLAFERGYNALPGIVALDIVSWAKFKEAMRELHKPDVIEHYKSIIVDTVDVAADMCSKYICKKYGADSLREAGGFGTGWTAFKDEFNSTFRELTQLGYAVLFIGHHKEEKIKVGDADVINIRPALANSVRGVIEGMADIYGYAHQSSRGDKMSILTLRTGDDSVACGGRFKYIPDEIAPMSYNNLVKAVHEAIDKEALETGGQFVSNERETFDISERLEFNDVMNEFNKAVATAKENLSDEIFNTDFAPRLTEVIETYLGKGKKMSSLERSQVEIANLVLGETKDLIATYGI